MSDTPETESTFRTIEAAMVAWANGDLYTEDVQAVMRRAGSSASALERRANEAEAKGKRVLARLIKAREFLPMDMRAYQELQDAINELQQ